MCSLLGGKMPCNPSESIHLPVECLACLRPGWIRAPLTKCGNSGWTRLPGFQCHWNPILPNRSRRERMLTRGFRERLRKTWDRREWSQCPRKPACIRPEKSGSVAAVLKTSRAGPTWKELEASLNNRKRCVHQPDGCDQHSLHNPLNHQVRETKYRS